MKKPSCVSILLGDCHGKLLALTPETWRALLEQKHLILSYLQQEDNEETHSTPRIHVGNFTLRFGKLNNVPLMRFETPETRISLSKNSVCNMFNFEHCVNRLIYSLAAITGNVDAKLSRFIEIASNVNDRTNIQRAIREHESFDRNDIIDCELAALYFGSLY